MSRIYEETAKNSKIVKKELKDKGRKIISAKESKHMIEHNGKKYWRFDTGIIREIPRVEARKKLIIEAHEDLLHGGLETAYHKLKSLWYWLGIKSDVANVIKECEKCSNINRKKGGGCDFVTTSRKFERVALDIMKLNTEDKLVLLGINYFSRFVTAK
ncbi:MAG: integrase zinc binding domain-containing protein, partial [Bacteroidales bacterium]